MPGPSTTIARRPPGSTPCRWPTCSRPRCWRWPRARMPDSVIQFLTSTGGLIAMLAALAAAGALAASRGRVRWRLPRRSANVAEIGPALRALLAEIEDAADTAVSRAETQVRRLQ